MRNENQKGFTLIELLIVMAVIAILAVAVLSAINPIEQLRKAEDSRRRSDTAELLNSLERYYTTYRKYPWDAATVTATCPKLTGSSCTTGNGDINGLVLKDELKDEFKNRALVEYFMTRDVGADTVHVCFKPTSTTWQDVNVAKFNSQGATWVSGERYVCVPE